MTYVTVRNRRRILGIRAALVALATPHRADRMSRRRAPGGVASP